MADEKEEEVNEFVKAAEEWDNENTFEEYIAPIWLELFANNPNDHLPGFKGSRKCAALWDMTVTAGGILPLLKDEYQSEKTYPLPSTNSELSSDWNNMVVANNMSDGQRIRFDFLHGIYIGSFKAVDLNTYSGDVGPGATIDAADMTTYSITPAEYSLPNSSQKKWSCKAIADMAYEHARAADLFEKTVAAPLSDLVADDGGDAIRCALKIQNRAGDLAKLIERFEKESTDPVMGIFPDQTAMTNILHAPPDPHKNNKDPLLTKIGITNRHTLNVDYLKYDNIYSTTLDASGLYGLASLNNPTITGEGAATTIDIEEQRRENIRAEDINESVQADMLAAEAYTDKTLQEQPIILYDPSYKAAGNRASNLIVPDMIYVDNNGTGQATAANNILLTYSNKTESDPAITSFPYYWSSVVTRMITVAKRVLEVATTGSFASASLAKISSGQNVGQSLDGLFNDNHGNGLMGTQQDIELFTDGSKRGRTLYDMLNVGEYRMSPSNSDIRFIIDTYNKQGVEEIDSRLARNLDDGERRAVNSGLDYSLDILDKNTYTFSGWCDQVLIAAKLMRDYEWGDRSLSLDISSDTVTRFRAAADWLFLVATIFKQVADEMAEWSQCILDADENLTEEAWELQSAFDDALGDNEQTMERAFWFDKQVKDHARNAAIAAQDLELDDLQALDDTFAGVSKAERALFKEQCFLLSYIGYFSNEKKNRLDMMYKDGTYGSGKNGGGIHKRLPYTNLHSLGIAQPTGYKETDLNASLMVDGDPYGFISKLTQSPRYGALYDIDHWHLSALQPKIRLFKVVYDFAEEDDVVIEKEVEISFDSHFSKDELDLFKSSRSRGAGVGLKSFEFTYDGSNPFAAKKSIKANLKIFASTFNELFVERTGDCAFADSSKPRTTIYRTKGEKYRYVDLALKTLTVDKRPGEYNEWRALIDENEKLAKLNFRLKAVVGWTSPKGNLPDDLHSHKNPHGRYNNEELKGALADSFVTLNLTPTVHNFEFDEQGRVIMNINYLAYVEDFFDQTAYNVFADPKGRVGFIREKRKLQMKALRSSCEYDDAGANDKTLQDLEEEYANSVDKEIKDSIKSIMETLMNKNKVYFVSMETSKIKNHTALGPYVDIKDVVTPPVNGAGNSLITNNKGLAETLTSTIGNALDKLDPNNENQKSDALAAGLAATDPYNYFLGFFYVSDLIDTVLENIEEELKQLNDQFKNLKELKYVEDVDLKRKKVNIKKFQRNFKRLRILLGPVEFIEYKRSNGNIQDSSFVNFGDIPVSVKYFVEFLADRALSREDSFYSLTSFLNDFFNNLISNFLNNKKCFAFSTAQRVRVNQSTITSFNHTQDPDEITSLILKKARTLKNNKDGNPARISLNDAVVSDYQRDNSRKSKKIRSVLNISGLGNERNYIPINNEINYFTFFAGRVQPVERMNGKKAEDHQNGIFHYLLGRDRGLVKNISLSKTETPGLQEVRFEQEGYEGLEQLRVVYDADIECYSNVNTFPGTYIYIDPKGFDPSLAKNFDITKYGVGGYYMIIKSTHRFAAGEAKSKIHAKWVAQLQTSFPVESIGKINDKNTTQEGSASRCKRAVERLKRLQESEGS